MGKRIVEVSGQFLVDFCKAYDEQYRVKTVSNALPADARLVRVMGVPSAEMVRMLVESDEWPEVKPYVVADLPVIHQLLIPRVETIITMIHDDAPQAGGQDE